MRHVPRGNHIGIPALHRACGHLVQVSWHRIVGHCRDALGFLRARRHCVPVSCHPHAGKPRWSMTQVSRCVDHSYITCAVLHNSRLRLRNKTLTLPNHLPFATRATLRFSSQSTPPLQLASANSVPSISLHFVALRQATLHSIDQQYFHGLSAQCE
jgi:hypothetical protein